MNEDKGVSHWEKATTVCQMDRSSLSLLESRSREAISWKRRGYDKDLHKAIVFI